jgi:hypothetical protein
LRWQYEFQEVGRVDERSAAEWLGLQRVDLDRPNAARVYDYWLGGAANFAIDRELGDEVVEVEPRVVEICRANRAFLSRVVNQMVRLGVRQFLDLGSGVPTVGNVHETAQRADPGCRVAYVDIEPVADVLSDIAARTKKASTSAHPKEAAEVRRLFGDCALIEPGMVWVEDWRPCSAAPPTGDPCGVYAGVGAIG